jgi:hypothetical protein
MSPRKRPRRVVVKSEVRVREMRFPECIDCKFFRPNRGSPECFSCGAGEYFEAKVDDSDPDDNELMKAFGAMGFDDE